MLSVLVTFTNSPSYHTTSSGPIHFILYLLTESELHISASLFRNAIDFKYYFILQVI